ncbi:MAG: DNA-deoxyinosine glycosylase [Sphingomicrobium sp.]
MDIDRIKVGLSPIAASDVRLVILGSLPGDASLAAESYYAHPSNQFWRLLGGALSIDLAGLDYAARLEALAAAKVGLWDVIGSARRRGSLDQAIRGAAANPLAQWVEGLKDLRAVAFNGKAAATAGGAALAGLSAVELVDLPSSSAAHTLSFDAKARCWSALARYLEPRPPQSRLARRD